MASTVSKANITGRQDKEAPSVDNTCVVLPTIKDKLKYLNDAKDHLSLRRLVYAKINCPDLVREAGLGHLLEGRGGRRRRSRKRKRCNKSKKSRKSRKYRYR